MNEHSKPTTWGEVESHFHNAINEVVQVDRLVKRMQHDVTTTLAKGRQLAAESDHTLPMGISHWREHGMKYGYWEHFSEGIRELTRAQERQRILAFMSNHVHRYISSDEDSHNDQLWRNGWNACAQEIRRLLSQESQIAPDHNAEGIVSQQYMDGYNTALDDVVRLIERERG